MATKIVDWFTCTSLPCRRNVATTPPHYNLDIVMGKRPDHLKPPAHLSKSPPVPKPEPLNRPATDPLGEDPTRFGDWTLKGIAVDF
jgi:hypothetical protein